MPGRPGEEAQAPRCRQRPQGQHHLDHHHRQNQTKIIHHHHHQDETPRRLHATQEVRRARKGGRLHSLPRGSKGRTQRYQQSREGPAHALRSPLLPLSQLSWTDEASVEAYAPHLGSGHLERGRPPCNVEGWKPNGKQYASGTDGRADAYAHDYLDYRKPRYRSRHRI